MCAIVLLEGDINYYNTTFFAQRMMGLAKDKGQIPLECFAKKRNIATKPIWLRLWCATNPGSTTTHFVLEEMTLATVTTGSHIPRGSPKLGHPPGIRLSNTNGYANNGIFPPHMIWDISWFIWRNWQRQDTWARTGECCSQPRIHGPECTNWKCIFVGWSWIADNDKLYILSIYPYSSFVHRRYRFATYDNTGCSNSIRSHTAIPAFNRHMGWFDNSNRHCTKTGKVFCILPFV